MKQKSKQDIDKPKVQSLEDILKELDQEDELSDEEQEAERRMEELLAGELVRATNCCCLLCQYEACLPAYLQPICNPAFPRDLRDKSTNGPCILRSKQITSHRSFFFFFEVLAIRTIPQDQKDRERCFRVFSNGGVADIPAGMFDVDVQYDAMRSHPLSLVFQSVILTVSRTKRNAKQEHVVWRKLWPKHTYGTSSHSTEGSCTVGKPTHPCAPSLSRTGYLTPAVISTVQRQSANTTQASSTL